MKHSSLKRASLVLVPIIFLADYAPAQQEQQVQLEGLPVTLSLVKRTPTQTRMDWPKEQISLTAESVAVGDMTIHELLKAAHIFPDVEAFTMVYVLNPEIEELREIKVPRIRIPKVTGGPQLAAAFTDGFVVLLTVDKEKKERFNTNVKRLAELVEISKTKPETFPVVPTPDSVINSLSATSAILVGINQRLTQRFGRPISTEGLGQLNAQVELLNEILTKSKIGSCDAEKILAIEKDVKLKGRAFSEVAAGDAPDAPPDVLVTVKTLRAGNPVPNLRIYYVAEALKDNESEVHPFGVLSSPANKKLPEADYCFWASVDPQRSPVTNVLCLEIRRTALPEVQLTVLVEIKP